MTLSQLFRDILKDMIKKRWNKEPPMKPVEIDDDTPKHMGTGRRSEHVAVGTTHSVKNAKGERICADCGGEVVLVNDIKCIEACFVCGAKIVD